MTNMDYSLTNIDRLKQILNKVNTAPKHSAGQNFLICDEPIEAVITTIEKGPKKITELGAGIGTLTQSLLATGFTVRAIERDKNLTSALGKVIPTKLKKNLELINADLKATLWHWSAPYQLVGNIPYNLSGLIIRRLTQLTPAPTQAVIMVQKEVGHRLTATPPHMHLISLAIQLWGTADLLLNVPRTCFWPQPKVDSQLVLLTPNPDASQTLEEREGIMTLAKQLFQTRRKQIGGSLKKLVDYKNTDTLTALRQSQINATLRPQELSVEQWHALHLTLTTSQS
jgi:16S rRNA (adenine1518-N6/adenine1519-N6)-dimethyltransferase